jgi:hypothetical protein
MRLHISLVAIRGDHIGKAGDLLRLFGYGTEDGPIEVTGWDAAARHLGDHRCKAVYFDGEWTVIVEPELVLMTDEAREVVLKFAEDAGLPLPDSMWFQEVAP